MIEVLVSDLGQVVLPFDFTPAKAFLRARCRCAQDGTDPWTLLAALHERVGFGVGHCTTGEFCRLATEELGMDATPEEFHRAWSDVFREDRAVIELIRRVPVRYRVLLSNTNAVHWDWITRSFSEALTGFDWLLASQEIGLQKPDPAVYRYVESLTGLPPSAHLMLDDMAENVEAARACGWDGIVHVSAEALEQELRARGLA